MTVVSLAEIKAKFSAYLQEAETSGPVVVTRKGRAVAVIVAPGTTPIWKAYCCRGHHAFDHY